MAPGGWHFSAEYLVEASGKETEPGIEAPGGDGLSVTGSGIHRCQTAIEVIGGPES